MLIVLLSAPLGVLCCYLAYICLCQRQRKVAAVLVLFATMFLGATLLAGGAMIFARKQLQEQELEQYTPGLPDADTESREREAGAADTRWPKRC